MTKQWHMILPFPPRHEPKIAALLHAGPLDRSLRFTIYPLYVPNLMSACLWQLPLPDAGTMATYL